MIPFATTGDDSKSNSPIQMLIGGTLGIPSILDSAPTTAKNQLPNHGDIGTYGGNIYINLGGNTYKITGTLV